MAEATIHQRLVAILAEMPAIGKNQRNEQQGFMFRGHDDVLNALNPLMAKHGVVYVPDVLERVTAQRTTSKGSVMFEVNLHVGFRFYGASGDYIEGSTWGEGTDMGDKATSKAMTMAFKSALNQTFAISNAETEDPDRQSPEPSATKDAASSESPSGSPASEDAAALTAELLALAEKLDATGAAMEAIENNLAKGDPAGHLVWLRKQIATATEQLRLDESPFKEPKRKAEPKKKGSLSAHANRVYAKFKTAEELGQLDKAGFDEFMRERGYTLAKLTEDQARDVEAFIANQEILF